MLKIWEMHQEDLLLLLHDNGQMEIKGSNFLGFEFKDGYRRHLTISCVVMKTFET